MAKTDWKKEFSKLYLPSAKEISVVDVPPMNFAMIDGAGDPNTSKDFQDALGALYGVSYTLKFSAKKAGLTDYTVMPLEGLWWTSEAGRLDFGDKDKFQWTAMIMQPDVVTKQMFLKAIDELKEKRNPPALPKIRFERFHEGLSVQILHIGPYAEERPTIEKLHKYIEKNGYKLAGRHHEIYLGDPRRTAPSRLKTVIRQPMKR